MELAFDSSSGNRTTTTASSLTWAHTCSGSSVYLFVGVFTDSGQTVTGVTYNGNAMTQLVSGRGYSAAPSENTYWYGIAIGTGDGVAHNIVVSATGANDIAGVGFSVTGANQTQADATSNNSGTFADAGYQTITTVVDKCWTLMFLRGGGTWTASTNSTVITNTNSGGQQAQDFIGAFYHTAVTPAGSLTMYATGAATSWGGVGVSIKPLTANPPTNFLMMFN